MLQQPIEGPQTIACAQVAEVNCLQVAANMATHAITPWPLQLQRLCHCATPPELTVVRFVNDCSTGLAYLAIHHAHQQQLGVSKSLGAAESINGSPLKLISIRVCSSTQSPSSPDAAGL